MDYLFFGINALAAGISCLLLFQHWRPHNHLPLQWVHYLAVILITAGYFSLDQLLLSQWFWGYFLANSLPVLVLAGSLLTVLKPQSAARS